MPLSDYAPEELYPRDLTKEEIEDPYTIIHNFFSYSHLPAIRKEMFELDKTLVIGDFNRLTKSERSDMKFLIFHLNKVIEAAHIIHTRQKKKAMLL